VSEARASRRWGRSVRALPISLEARLDRLGRPLSCGGGTSAEISDHTCSSTTGARRERGARADTMGEVCPGSGDLPRIALGPFRKASVLRGRDLGREFLGHKGSTCLASVTRGRFFFPQLCGIEPFISHCE
jgi:hypothetical protein